MRLCASGITRGPANATLPVASPSLSLSLFPPLALSLCLGDDPIALALSRSPSQARAHTLERRCCDGGSSPLSFYLSLQPLFSPVTTHGLFGSPPLSPSLFRLGTIFSVRVPCAASERARAPASPLSRALWTVPQALSLSLSLGCSCCNSLPLFSQPSLALSRTLSHERARARDRGRIKSTRGFSTYSDESIFRLRPAARARQRDREREKERRRSSIPLYRSDCCNAISRCRASSCISHTMSTAR